jgi:hypothetical protein
VAHANAELASAIDSRVELLSVELLEEHARRLAALLSIDPRGGWRGRAHLGQLKRNMRALRGVYQELADDARRESMSPATDKILNKFNHITTNARHNGSSTTFISSPPPRATSSTTSQPRFSSACRWSSPTSSPGSLGSMHWRSN